MMVPRVDERKSHPLGGSKRPQKGMRNRIGLCTNRINVDICPARLVGGAQLGPGFDCQVARRLHVGRRLSGRKHARLQKGDGIRADRIAATASGLDIPQCPQHASIDHLDVIQMLSG